MKVFIAILLICVGLSAGQGQGEKSIRNLASSKENGHNEVCISALREHVKVELSAAITYLSMAGFFAQDKINRPGLAKFFKESASEERHHAKELIKYLRMRGDQSDDYLPQTLVPQTGEFDLTTADNTAFNMKVALMQALRMEKEVTNALKVVVSKCDVNKDGVGGIIRSDYELADFITSDFLKEQNQGQRKIAGMINTLTHMASVPESKEDLVFKKNQNLGAWLFDRKVSNGEF